MYPYVAYVQFGLAVSELPTVFITNFYLMEKSFFLGCADDPAHLPHENKKRRKQDGGNKHGSDQFVLYFVLRHSS